MKVISGSNKSIPARQPSELMSYSQTIRFETESCLQFIDITEILSGIVARTGVQQGFMNVQSLHTTTAILVNEHEPLLLEDIRNLLDSVAPRNANYLHDDFSIRTVNMMDGEDRNGHAHCKAILLPVAVTLNIAAGRIQLGRWQRIFFVELDRAKSRQISISVLGL